MSHNFQIAKGSSYKMVYCPRLFHDSAVALLALLFSIALSPLLNAQEEAPANETIDAIILVDESAEQVLVLLEQITGKVILRQQSLPAVKINFNSRGPLSHENAILALESLLSLNGIGITPLNDTFMKAVPAAGMNTQAPELIDPQSLAQPSTQKIYSKFYTFDYLSVTETLQLIQPFLSPGISTLIPFEQTNSMLITDALINLQRVETIIKKIDRPAESKDEIRFYSLSHVNAEDLQDRLSRLQENSLKKHLSGQTTFEADERTNQIIVFTHKDNIPLIEDLIEKFDIDVAPRTQSEVYYIKHAEASEVTSLIESVISGQQQATEDTYNRNPQSQPTPHNSPAQQQPSPNLRLQAGALEEFDNLQFSEYVTLVSDTRSNAIVAYGTPQDLKYIKELIDKIDILLAQVRIEVVFTEVALDSNQTRGIDAFQIQYNREGDDSTVTPSTSSNNVRVLPFSIGALTLEGIALKDFSLDAIFGIAKSNSNVTVLSAPTIVTTHNQEANINVSQSEPIVTGTTSVTDGGTTSSIEFRDIGIQLTVKPLIGPNGVIQMEIEQIVENRAGSTIIDGNEQPIIGKREANSFVSVRDQETIILGGLQESRPQTTKTRLAVLGKLPYLGDKLFTRNTQSSRTSELIIFIKPYIITNTDAANEDAQEAIDRSLVRKEIRGLFKEGRFRPPDVPLIVEADPTKLGEQVNQSTEQLMDKALHDYNRGKLKKAKVHLREILLYEPEHLSAQVLLDSIEAQLNTR